MGLLIRIAGRHLLARKRQSVVSLLGIILGVGFFLAISALMSGSERDFMKRLVDNAPHITISDEYRDPRAQPVFQVFNSGALELRSLKPVRETRGIRGYEQIVDYLRGIPGVRASPTLNGQALVTYAGKDLGISLNGVIPEDLRDVSTIADYLLSGSVDDLSANPDGVLIGAELAKNLSVKRGDIITMASTLGQIRNFKVLGLFRTGRRNYDESQAFMHISRVQALLNRINRANSIIVKIPRPSEALQVSREIEQRVGYKSLSWQESSEDLMSTFRIRNTIMYTVVSAVLLVAAFGIYNVISTVVLEKQRDIAILKSMGFRSREVLRIFVVQGVLLGIVGCLIGLPFGMLLMGALGSITFRPPGGSEPISMPLDWGWYQFAIAAAFAMIAAIAAAYLPARKAASVHPVDILRGGT